MLNDIIQCAVKQLVFQHTDNYQAWIKMEGNVQMEPHILSGRGKPMDWDVTISDIFVDYQITQSQPTYSSKFKRRPVAHRTFKRLNLPASVVSKRRM